MERYTFAGLAAGLICGELIESAPPAGAGPDGSWQRCVVFPSTSGSGLAFNDPPTHIDD